ncbi:MAG: AMP-binding protein [Pseudomonadota bacterium]
MSIDTLPSWLNFQASSFGKRVAIRHKQLGIWKESTWSDSRDEVYRLVQLLKNKGFAAGDTLFLLTHPRPEALLISVAAQWLGGVAAPIDPQNDAKHISELFQLLKPAFLFAEGQLQVDLALQLSEQPHLIIYADRRGLSNYQHSSLNFYSEIIQAELDIFDIRHVAESEHNAFAFFRLDNAKNIEVKLLKHREMLMQARDLVSLENLTNSEEALVARSFAATGHVRYLLAPWLLAGFRLNFPENINTRDNDRRELGPTLVAGTKQTYERLESLIKARLPLNGTWLRKALDRAIYSQSKHSLLGKLIAHWLFLRPLRDVIGFSRTRVPLLVDEPLTEQSLKFFKALGINIRNWPDLQSWKAIEVEAQSSVHSSSSKKNQVEVNAVNTDISSTSAGVLV